jgi:hypothetical protein
MTRGNRQNLKGEWQFGNAAAGQAPPVNQTLAERINARSTRQLCHIMRKGL